MLQWGSEFTGEHFVMESFFHTLKADLIHGNNFDTEEELRYSIAGYLNHFYNKKRLQFSINYLSPVEYERIVA
jgi:putative transposase